MKGKTWDPQQNGFVFSAVELHRLITREQRLQEAVFYQNHAWNRRAHWQRPQLKMPQAA